MCWGFERFQIGDAVRLRLCEKEITTQVAVTRCKIISKVWMPAGHLCLKQDSLRRSSSPNGKRANKKGVDSYESTPLAE